VAELTPSGPPPTRREDIVDVIHGVGVADPYRWLEDGESAEVAEWAAAQNAHTRRLLDARPVRERWQQRLAALTALPTVLWCKVRGDRLFVQERAEGADQFALVLRSASDPDAPPRVLLDPAGGAADAAVAIDWYEPSPDGSLVALGLSEGGTEDSVLQILHVDSGEIRGEQIPRTRAASVAWTPDGTGFWYTRYPVENQFHRHVFFHVLGTDPTDDELVFDRLPTPEACRKCRRRETAGTCSSRCWWGGDGSTRICST
jgi:prolyl oligopeptidase